MKQLCADLDTSLFSLVMENCRKQKVATKFDGRLFVSTNVNRENSDTINDVGATLAAQKHTRCDLPFVFAFQETKTGRVMR